MQVFFATNRALTGNPDIAAHYGDAIIPATAHPAYGVAKLSPTLFPPGGAELLSGAGAILNSVTPLAADAFTGALLAAAAAPDIAVRIYLHGFGESLEVAVKDAATTGARYAAAGAASINIVFCWPTPGTFELVRALASLNTAALQTQYKQAQTCAMASGPHLQAFLGQLRPIWAGSTGRRVCLHAQSMGNQVLLAGVQTMAASGLAQQIFDTAVLSAPDIPSTVLATAESPLRPLLALAGRLTLFHNSDDAILKLSKTVNGADRLGQALPAGYPNPSLFPASVFTFADAQSFKDFSNILLDSHLYYALSAQAAWVIAAAL